MSSHQYGFTCTVPWQDRSYHVQVVYEGTHDDSEMSLLDSTADWPTTAAAHLAKHELEHRGDWTDPHATSRISVWGVYGGWLPDDPDSDPLWDPPQPSEREVLVIIARGEATDVVHGWDT